MVILALAAYFYYSQQKKTEVANDGKRVVTDDNAGNSGSLPENDGSTTGTNSGGTSGTSSGNTALPGQSPVTAALSPTVSETATTTPYPGSGAFDYTRQTVVKAPDIELKFSTKQIEQMKNNDICGLSNISDSWSDPFQKILCDITEYTITGIIEPLTEFLCGLETASINLNYDGNVKSEYKDGRCYIIDR